jgi:hypothetical protein
VQAQYDAPEQWPLFVDGTVTDGANRLAAAEVVLFKGNEVAATERTGRNGRFGLKLDLQEKYVLEFRHAGFVAKRIAIDTHMPHLRTDEEFEPGPLDLSISLLERARYVGAPTDDLDFPFAMVRFDRRTGRFEQDVEYTMGMQRVNGALLLMAARSEKR